MLVGLLANSSRRRKVTPPLNADTAKPGSPLLVHASSRSFRRSLGSSRLWNDRLLHGCRWHLRLVIQVSVFILNGFAVERVDQLAFPRLPYGRTITKSIVVLCKCRRRQEQYCCG